MESKYTIKVRTDDGKILGVSVIDGNGVKKESLDMLIGKGSRISFPARNMERDSHGSYDRDIKETYFKDSTRFGTKRAYSIEILKD